MKNIKNYILPALASAIFFTACNEQAAAPSQADIDAQVDAKIKSTTEQWKADCDKKIMDAAQLKKDSILVKMGKQAPAPVAPPKPKTPTPPPPPKSTTGGIKPPPTTPVVSEPAPVKEPIKTPSNTVRPGSNEATKPANNNTRPGSNEATSDPKRNAESPSNATRPGANK